ncbi:GrpB family protein [Desertihabitans aurantiacus]|uniref:GrpB family protein n=1 Tax=Desertihabitans aurantiacus TaxID=2282477 RepID=UPI001300AD2D|nr:GrpB family protein [Desertihabitans aurantiacus]
MRTTDEATVARARATAREAAALLARHEVPGELVLTGGSSLPGLLTKGDVDLHLRVAPGELAAAVERLRTVAEPVHPAIWTDEFATFERREPPVVGIAVTVVGGEHDTRFVRGWARLRDDPAARHRYNELKRGTDVEAAKSAFFDALARDPDVFAEGERGR